MCGVTGIVLADENESVALELLEALYVLQHRGQDACGISTVDKGGTPFSRKGQGLVSRVFANHEGCLDGLSGSMGLAHGTSSVKRNRGRDRPYVQPDTQRQGRIPMLRYSRYTLRIPIFNLSMYASSLIPTVLLHFGSSMVEWAHPE